VRTSSPPRCRPGSSSHLGYRLPTGRRGLLRVGPLHLERADPFGLARRVVRAAGETTLTVLPAIEDLAIGQIGGGRHEPLTGLSAASLAASGIEDLATLRPYVVGDDLRRVHWPSSARVDDLVVRRDEEHWQGHLTVVLDCRHHAMDAACFERAVSAAASLVHAVSELGDRIRLVQTDGFDSGMIDGRRSAGSLLEVLALVAQGDGEHDDPESLDDRRHSTAVVLTGVHGGDAALGPFDGYARLRFVRFVPTGTRSAVGDAALVVPADQSFAAAWSDAVRHQHVGRSA
jgi:uncharacterized protein (DUF58 family)